LIVKMERRKMKGAGLKMKCGNRNALRRPLLLTEAFLITVLVLSGVTASHQLLALTLKPALQGAGSTTEVKCMEPWQVAYPGSTVTFSLQIKNNGSLDDVYVLYVADPGLPNENWTARFYFDEKRVKSIGVPAYRSSMIVLSVSVPETAEAGDYSFRVNVDGKYSNASVVLTITVERFERGIEVTCPFQSQSITTGQTVLYPIRVKNRGERTESVFLQVNRTTEILLWTLSFSQSQVTLKPKESLWVTLTVESPTIIEEGEYSIPVIASTEDGEITVVLPLTVKIYADYLLEIVDIQPINPQVTAGERVEIMVTVRNLGHSPLTMVKLQVNSTGLPNIFVIPADVRALESMKSVTFYVRITPSVDATTGDYMIYIKAVSEETESSVRGVVVSVVSAIPWFWITISLTVIATAAAVIAIQRVASRYSIRIRR